MCFLNMVNFYSVAEANEMTRGVKDYELARSETNSC